MKIIKGSEVKKLNRLIDKIEDSVEIMKTVNIQSWGSLLINSLKIFKQTDDLRNYLKKLDDLLGRQGP